VVSTPTGSPLREIGNGSREIGEIGVTH